MMHEPMNGRKLTPREALAVERNEAERAMRDWLRMQAADRRPDGIHGGPFWFVIRVRRGSEWKTAVLLRAWGIRAWCPRKKRVNKGPRNGRRRYWREVLIPGYLLVQLAPASASFLGVLTFRKRVFGFVGTGTMPYRVDDNQISRLREMVAEPPSKAEGGDAMFTVGELVLITKTAFAGFEGNVEREDDVKGRLKVSVSLYGRPLLCELSLDQVAKL